MNHCFLDRSGCLTTRAGDTGFGRDGGTFWIDAFRGDIRTGYFLAVEITQFCDARTRAVCRSRRRRRGW